MIIVGCRFANPTYETGIVGGISEATSTELFNLNNSLLSVSPNPAGVA